MCARRAGGLTHVSPALNPSVCIDTCAACWDYTQSVCAATCWESDTKSLRCVVLMGESTLCADDRAICARGV
eukprot:741979-Prorocentrum_minimum.AAC.1